MMISPETFYEMKLKGKTAGQIRSTIRGLKNEIGRLKNLVEHPAYKCTMHPSERVRIFCNQQYLERAIQALEDVGGTYVPTALERKVIDFDNNIPYISKVEFMIGGYFNGYETKTYTINGDEFDIEYNHSLGEKSPNIDNDTIDKECFFEALKDLRIGRVHISFFVQ